MMRLLLWIILPALLPARDVAFVTGVIPSPDHVRKYVDQKHRTQKFWPPEWVRDQDLRTAFRVSAISYFRDVSGWSDPFWLGSSLRISPVEQVEFMDRLFANAFGLKPSTVAAVGSFRKQDAANGRAYFTTNAGPNDMHDIFPRRAGL